MNMSRCYCCGIKLTEDEMKRRNPDGSYEDMCGTCLDLSDMNNKPKDYGKEYAYERLTHGSKGFFRTPR